MVSPIIRLLWFLFVGWWLGLIWFVAAIAVSLTIIGIPIGFIMGMHLPDILFLR